MNNKPAAMKNKTYILDEDSDGLFSFEGELNKITLQELRSLQELQPDAQWFLFTQPETYKLLMAERQKKQFTQ